MLQGAAAVGLLGFPMINLGRYAVAGASDVTYSARAIALIQCHHRQRQAGDARSPGAAPRPPETVRFAQGGHRPVPVAVGPHDEAEHGEGQGLPLVVAARLRQLGRFAEMARRGFQLAFVVAELRQREQPLLASTCLASHFPSLLWHWRNGCLPDPSWCPA